MVEFFVVGGHNSNYSPPQSNRDWGKLLQVNLSHPATKTSWTPSRFIVSVTGPEMDWDFQRIL